MDPTHDQICDTETQEVLTEVRPRFSNAQLFQFVSIFSLFTGTFSRYCLGRMPQRPLK